MANYWLSINASTIDARRHDSEVEQRFETQSAVGRRVAEGDGSIRLAGSAGLTCALDNASV